MGKVLLKDAYANDLGPDRIISVYSSFGYAIDLLQLASYVIYATLYDAIFVTMVGTR